MTESIQGALRHCPEGRYTRLPDALIEVLPPRMHQLVHLLLSYRWTDDAEIRPYVGTLARRLGCSKRTVQRGLAWLEERGYIIVVARYRDECDDGHHGQTSNIYRPGPMLLPLLPRDVDANDGPAGQTRRDPMTPMSGTKKNWNQKTRMRQPEQANTGSEKDFFQSSAGPLKCRDCGAPATAHQTGWCTQPSRR